MSKNSARYDKPQPTKKTTPTKTQDLDIKTKAELEEQYETTKSGKCTVSIRKPKT